MSPHTTGRRRLAHAILLRRSHPRQSNRMRWGPRFAVSARRVAGRGHERFSDPEDDDQRRIARSLVVDLSVAADRLPESFRQAHPDIDWRGIRAVRTFIAHDDDGTDEDVLWEAIAVQFPAIVATLLPEGPADPRCVEAGRHDAP